MGIKLLVVDDEKRILDLMTRIGKERGHVVKTCSDPRQTLELLAADPPDALLIDLMMPELDGRDVLKRIKNTGAYNIPIFVMSASQNSFNVDICQQFGATHFIEKPFNPVHLFQTIEKKVTT